MFPTGKPSLSHGSRKIPQEAWTRFRKSVNSSRISDYQSLLVPTLHAKWCGTRENPGRFGAFVTLSTFHRNLKEMGFSLAKPCLVPRLSEDNIAERQLFAEIETNIIDNKTIPNYLDRLISCDSACFTFQPGTPLESAKTFVVYDTKKPKLRSRSLPDRTQSFEAFGAVAKGFRTDLVFVTESMPDKNNKPPQSFMVQFVKDHIVPLAARMRLRLRLPADADIFILLDGAGIMQAKAVKNELERNNIKLAGLARKCPECNIIEVIWSMTKTAIRGVLIKSKRRSKQQVQQAFFKAVKAAWNGHSQRSIDNLCDSYAGRVKALLAAKGKTFKYRGSKQEPLVEEEDIDVEYSDSDSDDE